MDFLSELDEHAMFVKPNVDKIYKDECVCSYDTAESEDGLYISMKSFAALGKDFLEYHHERYGNRLYLHHKRRRYRESKPGSSEPKPKRLAIGLEGGFDPDASNKDMKVEDSYTIIVMPQRITIPYPNPDLPEFIRKSADSIITCEATDLLRKTEMSVWDGEKRQVSKFAEKLEQITPAPRIPPSDWKCEKCDLRENLWLDLTDGSILCGRKFYDGSGGNNHALDHYDKVKHPLCVKLGTITATSGDVYSYPEEDMVLDPYLDKHLAHFGIDIQKMTKTEKSITEMEIDMNEKLGEWSIIQEEGKELKPVYGSGFTGLANLGNSCYINSVLQVLMSLPEFQERFYPPIPVYISCEGISDFNHQMAKLAYGLLSGVYSKPSDKSQEQKGLALNSFKYYVCMDHRDFATKRQQDAHEFLLFILDQLEQNDKGSRSSSGSSTDKSNASCNITDPSKSLEFVIEDRIQCQKSMKVKYNYRVECCLPLHVDLDLATNKDQIEATKNQEPVASSSTSQTVKPRISLLSCIQLFAKPEILSDFYSTAISAKTTAEKISLIAKFPRYFMFQMKKFQCGPDWLPRKLDVAFDVPDILDLDFLFGKGRQEGEEELEDSDGSTGAASPGEDAKSTVEPDLQAVQELLNMGIEAADALEALKACNNDTQRAIDYIFSPGSVDGSQSGTTQSTTSGGSSSRLTLATRTDPLRVKFFGIDDQPKIYQLKAFISHMGQSTMCGHYVCHIRKGNLWYIYNDNKVAESKNPPREFGYLYLYERVGAMKS